MQHLFLFGMERVAQQSYGSMTDCLQCCRNQKVEGKSGAASRIAVHLDGPVVGLYDGFGQGQPQTHALGILGKAAAVKALENMGEIFRRDSASIVLDGNPDDGAKAFPRNLDGITSFGVVQGVFDQVAHRFHEPSPVTQ